MRLESVWHVRRFVVRGSAIRHGLVRPMAQRALAVATTAKGGGFWGQSNQAWWPLVTTDHLSSLPPQAQAFAQQVSGLVAMKINEARVCWWRALQK